jgi:hypothetical protein
VLERNPSVTNLIFSSCTLLAIIASTSTSLKNRKPDKDYRLIPLMFFRHGTHNNRWNPGFGYQNIHIEFDYRPFPTKAGSLD